MTPKIYTNVLYVVVLRIGFVVLVTRPTILYSWTGCCSRVSVLVLRPHMLLVGRSRAYMMQALFEIARTWSLTGSKLNSITLSWSQTWSHTCSELTFRLLRTI